MINTHYRNYIITLMFVLMLILTACQKEQAKPLEGIKFTCTDIQYSATTGMPMDKIELTAIPSDFGGQLSLIVNSDGTENGMLIPLALNQAADGGSFHLPIHPTMLSAGGNVNVTLIDDEDNYCDPVVFSIQALPDSPGAYKKLTDLLIELGITQARVFEVDVTKKSEAQLLKENPFAAVYLTVDDMARGVQNPNSLEKIAANTSSLIGELTKEQWKLIDGMVEQSGVLQEVELYTASVDAMDTLPFTESVSPTSFMNQGLMTASNAANKAPLTCSTPWHHPDAAGLDKLMNRQIKNEIYGDGTELLDASGLLWGAAGALATAGGAVHAAKVANAMGTIINVAKIYYEAMEGLLPSEFVELNVRLTPAMFLEDDEQLEGTWDKAMVTARSRGWSADKVAFEMLLNALGGRVSKGMQSRFNIHLDEGMEAMAKFSSEFRNQQLTNHLYGKEIDRTGVYEIPPCDFGPTDISDENWSEVRIASEASAPVYLLDRYTYRARWTGEAILEIAPRGDRFGRRVLNTNGTFFFKDNLIEVLPIEVNVSPLEITMSPGTSTHFRATVLNANDKGVAWEVHPAGAHGIEIKTESDGNSVLVINTSKNEDDFPITITAISTSSTGLRALPDAPRREGHALIRSDRKSIEVTPNECCVETGEQQAFQAVVHNVKDQRITWTATAGTIDGNGLFTAPDEPGIVTVTATSVVEANLQKSVKVRVGNCDCTAEWEISAFGEKQSSNVSQIERAGADGEGRLTKMLFTNILNGENMQITFEGEGPLPDEQGTYPVKIINVGNEMSNRSIMFKNGQVVGIPSPFHPNGFYIVPPPGMEDSDVKPMHDELLAMVTIDEFTQLGSHHHHVWISGTIQGRVEAVEFREDLSIEANMGAVHLIGSISGSFEGHYRVRHKNPTVNPLTSLGIDVPFVGKGSVYWDVCGMNESEIPFAGSGTIDMQDILRSEDYINQMEPDDQREFQEFLDWGELEGLGDMDGLEGLEGLEDLQDIFKMIGK